MAVGGRRWPSVAVGEFYRLVGIRLKGRRTLGAKRANDIFPKYYKIGRRIGRVLFSRGEAWKMCICTSNR